MEFTALEEFFFWGIIIIVLFISFLAPILPVIAIGMVALALIYSFARAFSYQEKTPVSKNKIPWQELPIELDPSPPYKSKRKHTYTN